MKQKRIIVRHGDVYRLDGMAYRRICKAPSGKLNLLAITNLIKRMPAANAYPQAYVDNNFRVAWSLTIL